MKLQLSVWAEDLKGGGLMGHQPPNAFAVVSVVDKAPEQSSKPQLLGQTEVIRHNAQPDWTKLFVLDNYSLGQASRHVIVSLYHQHSPSETKALGSCLFDVASLLGSPGGIAAKELKNNTGIVVVHVESAPPDAGTLEFQFRAVNLVNTEGLLRKPDPFFEWQRLRQSVQSGARVWDTVYRSHDVHDSLNPVWNPVFGNYHTLCGGQADQKIRLAVFDQESSGDHVFMGEAFCTVTQLQEIAMGDDAATGLADDLDLSKALTLTRQGQAAAGQLIVVKANLTLPPEPTPTEEQEQEEAPAEEQEQEQAPPAEEEGEAPPPAEEEEIAVAAPLSDEELAEIAHVEEGEELVEEASSDAALQHLIKPTFANYMSGGCELRVMVAVDFTASNGNPTQPTSLHYFDPENCNGYQTALGTLCRILAKFDSDQMYPVFGFGAKRPDLDEEEVNHCFPLLPESPQVHGVEGILNAYSTCFKSGVVMSGPRDYSAVLETCAADATKELEEGHAYSILLLFTNGPPAEMEATVTALQTVVQDAPLSIVIVGLGDGDFALMTELENQNTNGRDMLRFIQYNAFADDPNALGKACLDHIPKQLETYFQSRKIYPNPEKATDEIVVQPYNAATDDIEVPIQVDENGQAVVTGEVTLPPEQPAATTEGDGGENKPSGASKFKNFFRQTKDEGAKLLKKHGKEVRRFRKKVEAEAKRRFKKQFPQAKFLL